MHEPIAVAPSETETVPLGTGSESVFATVTVKRIVWPYVAVALSDEMDVEVRATRTVCVKEPVLDPRNESPPYVATIARAPTARVEVATVHDPPPVRLHEPSEVPSAVMSTVPVASDPSPEVTLAVNVTVWP